MSRARGRSRSAQMAALECVQPPLATLRELAASRYEQTLDEHGVYWERRVLPGGTSVVLFGTPNFWMLFVPASQSLQRVEDFDALRKLSEAQ